MVCYGFLNIHIKSSFALGDWLINYSGGFIRRGLFGAAILSLSRFHLPALPLTFLVQVLLYIFIWAFLWINARDYRWTLWSLAFWLSPATLSFTVLNPPAGFRKELLLFALLCLVLFLFRRRTAPAIISVVLAIGLVIMVLCHEALLFFVPYLLMPFLLTGPVPLKRFLRLASLPLLAGAGAFLLVYTHPGTAAQEQLVCSAAAAAAGNQKGDLCAGAIAAIGTSAPSEHADLIRTMHRFHYFPLYGITLLLSVLPLVFSLREKWKGSSLDPVRARILAGGILASMLLTIPLFYVALDWGRWIYIHMFCSLVLLLFAYSNSTTAQPEQPATPDTLLLPRHRFAAAAALFVYATLWTLPYYGEFPARTGYLGLVQYMHAHKANHARLQHRSSTQTPHE